jgi:hypothetical protein
VAAKGGLDRSWLSGMPSDLDGMGSISQASVPLRAKKQNALFMIVTGNGKRM